METSLSAENLIPEKDTLLKAAEIIRPYAHITPVYTSHSIDDITGSHLYFKCENFQKVGAFKFRGACHAVFRLSDDEAAAGVATHSSGNHAQAVALSAKIRGIPAYIVMPENAPRIKVQAVKEYGADITFCAPTLNARETTLKQVVRETGATFIHPYNNPEVIAGQATAAMELLESVPDLDWIIAPVGGGGLLSGTALAARYFSPETEVFGAEPVRADDAYRSFHAGHLIQAEHPDTIADGLRTSLGNLTFTIIHHYVQDIFRVEEATIIRAMRMIWERMKLVIEPSAAVGPGALIEQNRIPAEIRIGIILSGGNVDLTQLPWNHA